MTEGTHIPQDELALYAMQALSGEEMSVVDAHLKVCAPCRSELAEVSGDLALVAMSVEQHELPAGARDRFLNRIGAAGEARPDVGSAQSSGGTKAASSASVVSIESRRKPFVSGWVPWAVAAALAICAAGLEFEVRSLRQQVRSGQALLDAQTATNARAHEVMELLTTQHAQHVVLTAAAKHLEPTARAVYLPSRGALILQASNLAPLPSGKAYELWVIPTSGAPVAAGVFKPDSTGSASLVLPPIPRGVAAKAFGVTVENEQGSQTPTSAIILSGAAPAAGE